MTVKITTLTAVAALSLGLHAAEARHAQADVASPEGSVTAHAVDGASSPAGAFRLAQAATEKVPDPAKADSENAADKAEGAQTDAATDSQDEDAADSATEVPAEGEAASTEASDADAEAAPAEETADEDASSEGDSDTASSSSEADDASASDKADDSSDAKADSDAAGKSAAEPDTDSADKAAAEPEAEATADDDEADSDEAAADAEKPEADSGEADADDAEDAKADDTKADDAKADDAAADDKAADSDADDAAAAPAEDGDSDDASQSDEEKAASDTAESDDQAEDADNAAEADDDGVSDAASDDGDGEVDAAAGNEEVEPEIEQQITDVAFSFEGPFGKFDQFQLQRGLQVYTEVCSSCHGLRYVPIRTLGDPGGPGLPEDQVRAYAATMDIDDPETEETRPRLPTDHFPHVTDADAPDLSVMAKARAGFHGPYGTGISQFFNGIGGPEYIYSILTHYTGETKDEAGETFYENTAFPGGWIKMPPPLDDDMVTYEDGTEATLENMSKDLAAFLMWTAEPKMMARKQVGFVSVLFLIALTVLLYLTNKRLWWRVKHGQDEA